MILSAQGILKPDLHFTFNFNNTIQFSSVQSLSRVWLCDPMNCSTPGLPVHHHPGVHPNSCPSSWWHHPAISSSIVPFSSRLPGIRVFFNESVLPIRWPKYCSFGFSISPSNEYSGLISFTTDWFDLLAVQGTLKSIVQHHSSKTSVLRCSAFFMVQLSYPYMTTGKTITLRRQLWHFLVKWCLCFLICCLGLS